MVTITISTLPIIIGRTPPKVMCIPKINPKKISAFARRLKKEKAIKLIIMKKGICSEPNEKAIDITIPKSNPPKNLFLAF